MTASDAFTGLNPLLFGRIYPLKRTGDGAAWETDRDQQPFEAPLEQASLDMASTWQSPFEGAGVESKFPALAQMAQAGMFTGVLHAIGHQIPKDLNRTKEFVADIEKSASQLVGRSGVTKLNSTQVYSGAPPIKIQITAILKAFKDPWSEVEEPLKRLQEWILPRRLAKDGVMAELIRSGADMLTLMPSEVPTIVGFQYKNRTYSPMVIEAMSDPLDAPIDAQGHRIWVAVQITICSLTALDRKDWGDTYVETGRMYF